MEEGRSQRPATTINAGASSWWGLFIQCGGTPRMMAGCACQLLPSGWSLIQLMLSTSTWSTRSSSQPALSIRLVAHPAVVVNYNMESKIIIFSTSPLHQAPLQLAAQALQPYALKQGGACEVFSPRVRVQHSKFDARLEALVAKYTGRVEGQVRVEATRDLPKFNTFSNNRVWESKSYSVHMHWLQLILYI